MQHPMGTALPKSFLYVPGDQPKLFDKAARSTADALILDLEDAVPIHAKEDARAAVSTWLSTRTDSKKIWVRIDADAVSEDLAALSPFTLDGIVLAKAELEPLALVDDFLPGNVPVIGLIESARGLMALPAMSAVGRVLTFGVGEVDLLADLRIRRNAETASAIDHLRLQIVVACAAAGLAAPLAPTSTDFRDLDAFSASTRRFVDLGFRSRTAIHPAQCSIINDALTPDSEQAELSKDIIGRLAAANGGTAVDRRGRLIDTAVAREAAETLARSEPIATEHSSPDNSRN